MLLSRVERDNKYARTVFRFLCEHNPFERLPELCNIISDITGDSSVNVHQAVLVGEAILEKMYGVDAFEFSFSKKDFAVVLDQTRQLNIDGEKVQVDPQLLFQRLLAIGKAHTDENDIDQLLQYELSPSPPVLFDEYGLLIQARKTQLAESLSQTLPTLMAEVDIIPIFTVYDGGSLLYRIQWKKDSSYSKSVNSM